jgi:ribosome biogenesis SPOUT family RNA methylase Rps3
MKQPALLVSTAYVKRVTVVKVGLAAGTDSGMKHPRQVFVLDPMTASRLEPEAVTDNDIVAVKYGEAVTVRVTFYGLLQDFEV